MNSIPRSPLILGLSGTLPFIWGALTVMSQDIFSLGQSLLGARFVGPYVMIFYGAVILSFMSGVLWGFATKLEGAQATRGYILSVVPALWVFFTTGGGPAAATASLMAGFIGILSLDWYFWRQGVAPAWWMQLRIMITAVVIACLSCGVLFG